MGESDLKDEEICYTTFKIFYRAWEEVASQAFGAWLGSPIFAGTVTEIVNKSSEYRKYLNDLVDRVLEDRGLPTKREIIKMAERICNIEIKVNDIEDKLNEP